MFPLVILQMLIGALQNVCEHISAVYRSWGPLQSIAKEAWWKTVGSKTEEESGSCLSLLRQSVAEAVRRVSWSTSHPAVRRCHSCSWSLWRSALEPQSAGGACLRKQVAARGIGVFARLTPRRASPARPEVSQFKFPPLSAAASNLLVEPHGVIQEAARQAGGFHLCVFKLSHFTMTQICCVTLWRSLTLRFRNLWIKILNSMKW